MTTDTRNHTAQHAQLTLHIAGSMISVQRFKAIEGINQPLWMDIHFQSTQHYRREDLIDTKAWVQIQAIDGHSRVLVGRVERVSIHYSETRNKNIHVRISSTLHRGQYQPRSRLFVQQDRMSIVRQLLDEMGYERHEIDWRVSSNTPMPTPVLQAEETNVAFFERLLSEAGWLYWPSADHDAAHRSSQSTPQERLVITERSDFAPLDLPTLDVPRWVGETGAPHINRLVDCRRACSLTPYGSQHTQLTSGERPASRRLNTAGNSAPQWETFNPPLEESATQHRLRIEQHLFNGRQESVHIVSHQPRLCVGTLIDLNANARFPEASGQYNIVRVAHYGEQPNTDGQPGVVTYRNDTQLSHHQHRLYPSPPSPLTDLPLMFPATIESKTPHMAQLDSDGRYYLRAAFDGQRSVQPVPHAEASPAIEVMAPYVSPQGTKDQPVGWHFPLLNNSTVLVGCLNGDPNRPVILGFTPNRLALGPVTSNNAKQYRLLTPSQHELTFDDTPANPCIILQTFNGDIRLSLNAQEAEPFLELATQYGAINIGVAQDLRIKALAGNLEERVGGQRNVQVKDNSTTTVGGTVHHQAGANLNLSATENLELHADGNMTVLSKGNISLSTPTDIKNHALKGYQLTVPKGAIISRVNGHITVQSDSGNILLTQGDAGVHITPQKIHIFGNKVTLQGTKSGVNFNGDVEYETGAGNEPVAPPVPAEVEPHELTPLAPQLHNAITTVTHLAWGDKVAQLNETVAIRLLASTGADDINGMVRVFQQKGDEQLLVDEFPACITPGSTQTLDWTTRQSSKQTHQHQSNDDKGSMERWAFWLEFEAEDGTRIEGTQPLFLKTELNVVVKDNTGAPQTHGKAKLAMAYGQPLTATINDGYAHFCNVWLGDVSIEYSQATHQTSDGASE